jgi:hypothetical protein
MNIKLNKNQIIILLIPLFLLIVFPFVLKLSEQRQEIRKRAVGTGVVKLTLSPTGISKQRGDVIDVKIQLTSTQQVRIYTGDVDLQFDTNVFAISDINCAANFPTKAKSSVSNNIIYLTCGVPTAEGQPPLTLTPNVPVELGSFQAKVKNDAPVGETRILFNRARVADENFNDVADAGTPGTYTIKGIDNSTSTSSPGQVKVRFRIKFMGIDTQKPDQQVKIQLKSGLMESVLGIFDHVNVSAVNISTDPNRPNWVYQSEVITLPDTVSTGYNAYYITIKGPKHLATRFCKSVNQARPCSIPQTKMSGLCLGCDGEISEFDFTGYPLPGGDLPPQDGVVNALDAVTLINCLGESSSNCIEKADLNLDGIVNTLDINIMNNAIYTRWEDE